MRQGRLLGPGNLGLQTCPHLELPVSALLTMGL